MSERKRAQTSIDGMGQKRQRGDKDAVAEEEAYLDAQSLDDQEEGKITSTFHNDKIAQAEDCIENSILLWQR